jgi:1,4-alpha-glucan branching enzyme
VTGPEAIDTIHVVRFVLVAPGARHVTLVGDFNAWAKESTPLVAAAVEGVWSVSVPLLPGRHEYAFVVDGERWVVDPMAAAVTDDFGTETSIVTVGSDRAT